METKERNPFRNIFGRNLIDSTISIHEHRGLDYYEFWSAFDIGMLTTAGNNGEPETAGRPRKTVNGRNYLLINGDECN